MALRAQSTGPSCKLNNAAVSTDMYRVWGQTQTSSSRTRFLYLPIFLLPSILMFYRPIFSSSVGLLPWSYSLYTRIVIREYLRVDISITMTIKCAGDMLTTLTRNNSTHTTCVPWPVIGLEKFFPIEFHVQEILSTQFQQKFNLWRIKIIANWILNHLIWLLIFCLSERVVNTLKCFAKGIVKLLNVSF